MQLIIIVNLNAFYQIILSCALISANNFLKHSFLRTRKYVRDFSQSTHAFTIQAILVSKGF